MTDEIKVTIAAQACLMVVGMDEDLYFDHVLSILVYPTGYVAPGHMFPVPGWCWKVVSLDWEKRGGVAR